MTGLLRDFYTQSKIILICAFMVVISAVVNSQLAIIVYLLLVFWLFYKKLYTDLFLFYLFLLILSDNRDSMFTFASQIKPLMALFVPLIGWKLKGEYKLKNPIVKSFLVFIFFCFISLFFSPNAITSFQKVISYLFLLGLIPFYVGYLMKFDKNFEVKINYFIILILIIGFIIMPFSNEFVFLKGRYRGFLGNPNGLGLFITCALFLSESIYHNRSKVIPNNIRLALFSLCSISLLLSQSRNGIFVLLLYILFLSLNKYPKFLLWLLFFSFVGLYSSFISWLPALIIQTGLEEYFRLDTLIEGSGRLTAWSFAWAEIQDNPYLGNGFGYTEILFKKNYFKLSNLGHQGNAHNSFLTFWLDVGFFGLVGFLIGLIKSSYSRLSKNPVSLPILFGILFSINFESWITASLNPFTILIISTLTIFNLKKSVILKA